VVKQEQCDASGSGSAVALVHGHMTSFFTCWDAFTCYTGGDISFYVNSGSLPMHCFLSAVCFLSSSEADWSELLSPPPPPPALLCHFRPAA
jgi:hypothetical protein